MPNTTHSSNFESKSDDENTELSEGETCCKVEIQVSDVLKSIHQMRALVLRLQQIEQTTHADTPMSPQSPGICVSPIRYATWSLRSKPNLHAKLDSTHLLSQQADNDCDADIEIRLKSKHRDHQFKKLAESALPGHTRTSVLREN
jgi:hypothetical protein